MYFFLHTSWSHSHKNNLCQLLIFFAVEYTKFDATFVPGCTKFSRSYQTRMKPRPTHFIVIWKSYFLKKYRSKTLSSMFSVYYICMYMYIWIHTWSVLEVSYPIQETKSVVFLQQSTYSNKVSYCPKHQTRCVCEPQIPPIMANTKDGQSHKD